MFLFWKLESFNKPDLQSIDSAWLALPGFERGRATDVQQISSDIINLPATQQRQIAINFAAHNLQNPAYACAAFCRCAVQRRAPQKDHACAQRKGLEYVRAASKAATCSRITSVNKGSVPMALA